MKQLITTLSALLVLAGCSKPAPPPLAGRTVSFSVLSAEDQQSMARVWQPLFDDMQKATGLTIKPYYAANYASLVEAMRFNQTQAGWFAALSALEATRRADAQVIGRILTSGAEGSYRSVLIVKEDSKITLDDVLKCGKKYNFGIGDPNSTSGTLAPMAYVFVPHDIEPADCFKTVKSADHKANFYAVANGLLDVATNNTVGLLFYARENPQMAKKIKVIWESPELPESSIVVRKDLDPAVKEKIRQFFLSYGQAPGAAGDKQRAVLKMMTYTGFAPTDNSYLDPVRQMEAATNLAQAKHGRDAAKIAAAQKVYDALQAELAAKNPASPPAPIPVK